jgi:methyl-accepting chemotaxis protein
MTTSSTAAPRPVPGKPPAPRPARTDRPDIRFGILGRTTVAMLAVGLAPLGLFGAITISQQSDRVRMEAERSLREGGERVTAQVDEWFDKNVRVLRAAANLPEILSMNGEAQTHALTAIQRAYPWMYLVFTIRPDGKNIARSDGKPLTDYGDRQYYKDVIVNGKDLAWETLIGKTSKKPAVILAMPIVVNGATVGVLAAAMTVEDVSGIITKWRLGQTGFAFVVDEKGKVVAHPREDYVLGQVYLTDHPLVAAYRRDSQPHALGFMEADGKDALGYVQGNRFGWAVVSRQETEELFAPLRQTLAIGLALLAGAAAIVALTGWAVSRVLVRPILDLSEAADRMSTGDLDAHIVVTRVDEIGVLAKSLERLRISMRAAMARIR